MSSPEDDRAAVAVQSAFDELGRLSFAEHSLESVLHTVTILRDRGPATVAYSGALPLELDEQQYRFGNGPCLAAARSGQPSEIPDTRRATEWAEVLAAPRNGASTPCCPFRCRSRSASSVR